MPKRTIIPFGPHHPVLPEPIHLDLVLEDELVVEAIPSLGFVHRGLELLAAKKDFNEMTFVAERICGICSFIHGLGYCQAIENIMAVEVPRRARHLRVFWSELSRIHSHLLWLGLAADSVGFESLFMQCWRVRERILEVIEETSGGRVIFGVCKVGGVRKDVTNETLKRLNAALAGIEKECEEIGGIFREDCTILNRFTGVGPLSKADAIKLGAVGPTVRGSGVAQDLRSLRYAAYDELKFEPIIETAGDCQARCLVRVRELSQSFDLIRQVVERIPEGAIDLKTLPASSTKCDDAATADVAVPKKTGMPSVPPKGEFFSRLEQPRGEVVYYVISDGTKNVKRFRVRTPTFANIPPLLKMLAGCQLGDVPAIVLTIDPCISCTER